MKTKNSPLLKHFFLVRRHPVDQPAQDFFTSAAHGVLTEPPVFIILHLDVLVHDVGPLFQIFELVFLNLGIAAIAIVPVDVVLDTFAQILI